MENNYAKCLEIYNESMVRLHKDNVNFQDAQQVRIKTYQKEIETLQAKIKELTETIKKQDEIIDKLPSTN